ncbi:MAG: DUF255 domain-containing protein, partial [Firmicutes bacterium]|nr:DUF255 domain-containing protein [Bacillota bacterium]
MKNTTGIRIHPGAERARDIDWYEWGRHPFGVAKAERKPVLLAISGVWCHWCHVMDQTTYSDPEVIRLINERFVPIRVDTDMRPDINDRYNMGGWPTTAILTPDGTAIAGATYIPPRGMTEWLNRVLKAYPAALRVVESEVAPDTETDGDTDKVDRFGFNPSRGVIRDILGAVVAAFDREHGGFGRAPKFPMTDAIDAVIGAYVRDREPLYREIFAKTIEAMTGGGTYDHVEGGLFRYSTNRDWSVPHFEKMLLDNSLLLAVLVRANAASPDPLYPRVASDIVRYLNATLFMPVWNGWAGSQDADEEYYLLPLEERVRVKPPSVDRTLYVDLNGIGAQGMIKAGQAFERTDWIKRGIAVLESIFEKCFSPDRGLAHFFDGEAHVWGLAHDLISVGAACLAAHGATGESVWIGRSAALADRLIANYAAADAGFYSRFADPEDPPALARPVRNFAENAYAAVWLVNIGASVGDRRYRNSAHSALAYCDSVYEEYGIHAAPYALALEAYLAQVGAPEGM